MKNESNMPPRQYVWQGYSNIGKKLRGQMTSENKLTAIKKLQQQGICIQTIQPKNIAVTRLLQQRINKHDILLLLTHLHTMLTAGLSLEPALAQIQKSYQKPALLQLIHDIRQDINGGTNLSNALSKHRQYFPDILCQLITIGEQTGQLGSCLNQAIVHLEKVNRLKQKIIKALFYPLTVVMIAFAISILLLIFMVPKFSAIYASYQTALPTLTQWICNLSLSLIQSWKIWLLGLASSVTIISWAVKTRLYQSKPAAFLLIHVKWVGIIYRKLIITRLTNTLSILLTAGINIDQALLTAATSTNHYLFHRAIVNTRAHLLAGHPLSISLATSNLFPDMMIQMVNIGEKNACLERMLNQIAKTYYEQTDQLLNSLCQLIEPLVMLILGLIIGTIVIALYLPIFNLGSVF